MLVRVGIVKVISSSLTAITSMSHRLKQRIIDLKVFKTIMTFVNVEIIKMSIFTACQLLEML